MSARQDRLPFHFRWLDRQMVVTKPLVAHPALRPGTRVLRVDDETDGALLARMLPLARADGGNDFKRIANMEVRDDASLWENFDVMWALDRSPPPAGVRVRLAPPQGAEVSAELPLLGRESRAGSGAAERLGWVHRHDGDATLLTMPSWTTYNQKWDWRGWLTGVIDEAVDRGSKRFVLDLRGNEGGEDCGDVLLARMIDAPLEDPGATRRVRFRETPVDMRPQLDTWDPSFHTLGKDAEGPDAAGFYTLSARGSDVLAPAPGRRLRAKLIVLIDSANSSATFQFAQVVRRNGLGLLLGEPTGGNQRGINGGAFFFVRLPASRLELDLPLIGYFPPGSPPDAGLLPDVSVPTTCQSIARGDDPQMARALALLLT
jgi:C-terminal processing protease CtpA/Prc